MQPSIFILDTSILKGVLDCHVELPYLLETSLYAQVMLRVF